MDCRVVDPMMMTDPGQVSGGPPLVGPRPASAVPSLHSILDSGSRRKTVEPPQLPPRPRSSCHQARLQDHLSKNRLRKYVFLCSVCGGLASLLGCLFLGVYVILRSYTSSLGYFETIPTYIPAAMLLLTGLGIMCLARRKNRYALLIKACGGCCLTCAGTCVLVTVCTTVVHMSRLQSLRECVYTAKTHTCICYSMLISNDVERNDDGVHYVFNSTPDCEVIHGALYSCLRAMFGLSVIGILVCIFCCMLVYQLLSHERKKKYWEQLELRCRYLYGQPTGGGGGPLGGGGSSTRGSAAVGGGGGGGGATSGRCSHCACSQFPAPLLEGTFDSRQWRGGRIGNLYSPNPEPTGCHLPTGSSGGGGGWGWRLPWAREHRNQQHHDSRSVGLDGFREERHGGYRRDCEGESSTADSQYGFACEVSHSGSVLGGAGGGCLATVSAWGPPPPYSDPSSPVRQPPVSSLCLKTHQSQQVSPRVKYLRDKRPSEISESEVYFADVSSCCNGSLEEEGGGPGVEHRRSGAQQGGGGCSERRCSNQVLGGSGVEHRRCGSQQPQHGPRSEERRCGMQVQGGECTEEPWCGNQMHHQSQLGPEHRCNTVGQQSDDVESPGFRTTSPKHSPTTPTTSPSVVAASLRFPDIPEERGSPDSELAEDGSEEDDPELVTFSRRTNLNRSHRNRLDLSQSGGVAGGEEDFSPMSVESGGGGRGCGGRAGPPRSATSSPRPTAGGGGSSSSPEFLAPDAQYETIPEPPPFERSPVVRLHHHHQHLRQTSHESRLHQMRQLEEFGPMEPNGNKVSVDRCNNPHYYGASEYPPPRYTNPDGLLRHHYEEIREPPHPAAAGGGGGGVWRGERTWRGSQDTWRGSQDTWRGSQDTWRGSEPSSPALGPRHYPHIQPTRRRSPECIALVDESLCSHNDSSCRCSMSINGQRVEETANN